MRPFENPDFARQAGKKSSRKGSPNKLNKDLRELVAQLIESYSDEINDDMRKLEPRDRVAAWTKLLEFALPKLTRSQSELSGIDGGPIELCAVRFIDDASDAQALQGVNTSTAAPAINTPHQAPASEAVLIVAPNSAGRELEREDDQEEQPSGDIWY